MLINLHAGHMMVAAVQGLKLLFQAMSMPAEGQPMLCRLRVASAAALSLAVSDCQHVMISVHYISMATM